MKKYPISDDIALLFDKHASAVSLRDIAIKLPFGYKKAFKASTDSIYFSRLFWKRVKDVYQRELEGKNYRYLIDEQCIEVTSPDNKTMQESKESS